MAKKMLIDATHAEETRVVVVDGNKVEEFDFESQNKRQIAGNIYLAKVTRVEPSLQAAFVDYGGNRHGFLAFSEIHPDYYQIPVADREALMAEEKAYAEAMAAEAEQEEQKPKRTRRRRAKPAAQRSSDPIETREVSAVDGMETIDLIPEDAAETTAPLVQVILLRLHPKPLRARIQQRLRQSLPQRRMPYLRTRTGWLSPRQRLSPRMTRKIKMAGKTKMRTICPTMGLNLSPRKMTAKTCALCASHVQGAIRSKK
jgi:Ribonuclease G/E